MTDDYERTGSSLEEELRAVVKDAVWEAHEEGVHDTASKRSSGRSLVPLLFVVGSLAVAAYLLWGRSGSMSGSVDQVTKRVQRAAERTAEQTEETSQQAADTVEKRGETLSHRTERMSQEAADTVQEGGTGVASRIEQGAEEAARKMDEAADTDEDSTTSGRQ
ncbi:hypothetical protein [Halobacterium wangiae]|uniref:hypothetical protein n=1 Tax=Halobacterium wangiae TaxID=2902623 RepID=UPI001E2E6967|nr:hypothetical protein [Halobacterium wangiae]